jgi:hypothetical protein
VIANTSEVQHSTVNLNAMPRNVPPISFSDLLQLGMPNQQGLGASQQQQSDITDAFDLNPGSLNEFADVYFSSTISDLRGEVM